MRIRGQMRDFVLSPPCVAHVPIVSSRARRMRVNLAMTGIDHQPCGGRLVNRNFRRPLPHSIIAPTDEASADPATERPRA